MIWIKCSEFGFQLIKSLTIIPFQSKFVWIQVENWVLKTLALCSRDSSYCVTQILILAYENCPSIGVIHTACIWEPWLLFSTKYEIRSPWIVGRKKNHTNCSNARPSFQGHEPIFMKTHVFKLCKKKKKDIKGRFYCKGGGETNLKRF